MSQQTTTRSAIRIKSFYKRAKQCQQAFKHICSIPFSTTDPRPFLPIRLLNRTVYGLLDSGASISCIGGSLAVEVLKGDVAYKPIKAKGSTADGSAKHIIGKLKLKVEYGNQEKFLEIFIVPSLQQELYLGIDFWRIFGLFPKELQIAELNLKEKDFPKSNVDQHVMTEEQQSKLKLVINCFPSFSQEGLGKTNLITHSIDVGKVKPIKQRHFPVSPAVEKEMCAEIDRMLSLGVIEEADSAWSSPIVMVTKPGKVRICLDCRKIKRFA